jgi:hypothetical protein
VLEIARQDGGETFGRVSMLATRLRLGKAAEILEGLQGP